MIFSLRTESLMPGDTVSLIPQSLNPLSEMTYASISGLDADFVLFVIYLSLKLYKVKFRNRQVVEI